MDNVLFVVWYAFSFVPGRYPYLYIYVCGGRFACLNAFIFGRVVSFASGMINNQNGK